MYENEKGSVTQVSKCQQREHRKTKTPPNLEGATQHSLIEFHLQNTLWENYDNDKPLSSNHKTLQSTGSPWEANRSTFEWKGERKW